MAGADGSSRLTGGLSWGLRFEGPHDPETLIAVDLAEALEKAHERALACRCSASLWRNGRRLAEVPTRPVGPTAALSRELLGRLAAAGWYVVGGPEATDFDDLDASSVARQADRIESR